MVSAISFGVFCRLADSTIEIMRSRKVSPGLTETLTIIQSDSTRVPPVTEAKSPPDSRITGADSPVMALSSTEAAPSMTSPSAGMRRARFDQHHIALAQILRFDDGCIASDEFRIDELLGQHSLAHAAQRGCLGAAAPFGECFGKIGEQHREDQPHRDGKNEGLREASPCPPSA